MIPSPWCMYIWSHKDSGALNCRTAYKLMLVPNYAVIFVFCINCTVPDALIIRNKCFMYIGRFKYNIFENILGGALKITFLTHLNFIMQRNYAIFRFYNIYVNLLLWIQLRFVLIRYIYFTVIHIWSH